MKRIIHLVVLTIVAVFVTIGCGGGGGGGGSNDGNPPPPASPWVGIKQISSSAGEEGYSIAGDSAGNIYMAGATAGIIDNNVLSGSADVLLCKYSASGNRLWTKYYGTTITEVAYRIIIDRFDNIFLAGWTWGSFTGFTNSGGGDALLIKLDSDGNQIFVTQFGTSGDDRIFTLTLDSTGNIYVAGSTSGSFPGFTNNNNTDDIFLAQLNSTGNINWIRQFGSPNSDYPRQIVLDGNNGVFISGYVIPPSTIQGSSTSGDSFLIKYSTVGVAQFVKQYSKGEFVGLQMDSFGNMYTLISNAINLNSFIVKIDPLGTIIWEKPIITTSGSGKALFIKNDSIYTVGTARGPLGTNNWNGAADVILLKYDLNGNILWSNQSGTSMDDLAHDIYMDNSENIFIAGTTNGAFPGNSNLGGYDAFILKYDKNGVLQ